MGKFQKHLILSRAQEKKSLFVEKGLFRLIEKF